MLLVAIGSGASLAVIILIVLISLIKHKKKIEDEIITDEKVIESPSGNFIFTTSASKIPESPAVQKSNLMFKYFGRSLSSFDVDKPYMKSDSVAINIELDNSQLQIYRKHVLTPSDVLHEQPLKDRYIQTIAV